MPSKQCSYSESVALYDNVAGRAEFCINLDSSIELLKGLPIGDLLIKQAGRDIPQKCILWKSKVITILRNNLHLFIKFIC